MEQVDELSGEASYQMTNCAWLPRERTISIRRNYQAENAASRNSPTAGFINGIQIDLKVSCRC